MGRRGRGRRRNDTGEGGTATAVRVPRIMQIPEGGVPEIARVYPEHYERLLEEKVAKLERLISQAVNGGSDSGEEPSPSDDDDDDDDNDDPDHRRPQRQQLPPVEVFESPREGFQIGRAHV